MLRYAYWTLILSSFFLASEAIDSNHPVKVAILLTRHGDRTPTKLYPNSTSQWSDGLGQLTGLGMKQMFDLGTAMRERYVDRFKLLSPRFHTDEIFVRSTSKDRTLMSAHALLAGLYPSGTGPKVSSANFALPGGTQPVPIHAADTHQDTLLYAYKSCPRLKQLRKSFHKSPEWHQLEAAIEPIMRELSPLYGCEALGLGDVSNIVTLMRQEKTHSQPSVSLDADLFSRMINVTTWLVWHKYPTREMGRLAGGNLLHDIVMRLETAAYPPTVSEHVDHESAGCKVTKEKKKLPKVVYYSAHDGTILGLFAAMGVKEFELPFFAANIVFELHLNAEGQFQVEIEYNGKDLQMPGCPDPCLLADFSRVAQAGISHDWFEDCATSPKVPEEWHPHTTEHHAGHVPSPAEHAAATLTIEKGSPVTAVLLLLHGILLGVALTFAWTRYTRDSGTRAKTD